MAEVRFELNRAAYEEFTGWEGPVGRDFQRRLRTLEYRARESAPVYVPDPRDPMPIFRTPGALRMSIRTVRAPAKSDQLEAMVGANPVKGGKAGYALYVNEGTRAHEIRPRIKRVLRFYWRRVGSVVIASRVHHPGTKATHFIDKHLPEAVK